MSCNATYSATIFAIFTTAINKLRPHTVILYLYQSFGVNVPQIEQENKSLEDAVLPQRARIEENQKQLSQKVQHLKEVQVSRLL